MVSIVDLTPAVPSRRAHGNTSSSATAITSSMMERFNTFGMVRAARRDR
jgi:hypothetical protein